MTSAVGDRAITCRMNRQLRMFRVLTARGNALGSGGFGVSIGEEAKTETEESNEMQDPKQNIYLFPEEALFLHQRCYLQIYDEDHEHEGAHGILDTSQLFEMLPGLGMSIPMYLVYCHLRNQDFRILRHSPDRYKFLKKQQDGAVSTTTKREVRATIRNAPAPRIIPEMNTDIQISWDAYKPSSDFAKTHPGLPDFYVAVAYYQQPTVTFQQLHHLLASKCHGIPLKVATVSDSGTVNMYGITSDGIPAISKSGGA